MAEQKIATGDEEDSEGGTSCDDDEIDLKVNFNYIF